MTAPGEGFLQGLALASLLACGLIAVVLILRRLMGAGSARWRMALWTVLVVRMALGWVPMPALVLTPHRPEASWIRGGGTAPLSRAADALPAVPGSSPGHPRPFPWGPLLLALWSLGAGALLLRLIQGNVSLWLAVRKGRVLTSQPELDLLERCKDDLGVRTVLGIVVTERVPSPALFGLVRPRLLLPPQVLETLPAEALRHVFLHELVHLKRWDILTSWVCSILQVVHWFNPFVWLAFRRLRADREVACDEGAICTLAPSEVADYGRTLIRIQELLAPPSPLPSLAGVMEEASSFTWRIKMIARFKQNPGTTRWTPLSVSLLGLFTLGAFSFTLAARGEDAAPPRLAHPIQDKVDYRFEDDPGVIGTWRVQGFVPQPGAFTPGDLSPQTQALLRTWEKEMPFMIPFSVRPGGGTSSALTWTKGLFLNDGDGEKAASRYEVRNLAGVDYLFMEYKNGDYTYRGMRPQYVAFIRESKVPAPPLRVVDKVDYPFVDDPSVQGEWHSVDYVRTPEDFIPGKHAWQGGELFLKRLAFHPGGTMDGSNTWTEGLILNRGQKTASRYVIRQIEGRPYLFMEWKSGDYTLRGMKPSYYVLTR